MKLSDFGKKCVFTTKVELDDDNYIIMREPSKDEVLTLSDDPDKQIETFGKLLPSCIIDSTFENDDGTKANGEQICAILSCSGSLYTDVVKTWLESLPFQSRLKKKEK